jgi:hypothetical protein
MSDKDIIDADFDFARSQYYKLAEDGQEAIELMMELARESEHPRAFEVLSTMMKQNAEITDRLMDLQKKKKDITQAPKDKGEPAQLTQNNVFVGSATDLQKMLHDKIENVIDQDE